MQSLPLKVRTMVQTSGEQASGPAISCDLAILGGGLAGGVLALAMAQRRPELKVVIVERGDTLGGDHVWSCFESDIAPGGLALLDPFMHARWNGYDVHFPGLSRRLSSSYRSMTGTLLDRAVRAALPPECVLTSAHVVHAAPRNATLADGRAIAAQAVIDARGHAGLPHMAGGWQKFMGQTLQLSAPHGLDRPVVMDARVEQLDGYRFVYCLPFSATEIFVEDTYYSTDAMIDRPALQARIAAYAAHRGWQVERVVYEETGVLPVVATGNFAAFQAEMSDGSLVRAGVRAGLFHPLTSYSLPDAVRFALQFSALDNLSAERLGRISDDWAAQHWRRGRFYRMLSRMLFGAAHSDERWRMLAHFYALPEALIERFYAGRSTLADMARILAGKPPVPVFAALASLAGRGHPLADLDARREVAP